MSLLYQPDTDDGDFYLTPEYDGVIAAWAVLHPEQNLGPGFTVAECVNFIFQWPGNPPAAAPVGVEKKGG